MSTQLIQFTFEFDTTQKLEPWEKVRFLPLSYFREQVESLQDEISGKLNQCDKICDDYLFTDCVRHAISSLQNLWIVKDDLNQALVDINNKEFGYDTWSKKDLKNWENLIREILCLVSKLKQLNQILMRRQELEIEALKAS